MSIWHIVMLSAGVIHPSRRTRSVATSGPIDRKSVSERIILSASSAGASFLRTASRAELRHWQPGQLFAPQQGECP